MRMRLWPTILRPAFSMTALMAPVRLRAVASGLMIENVRSTAIGVLFQRDEILGGRLIESMQSPGKAARSPCGRRLRGLRALCVAAAIKSSRRDEYPFT